MDQEFPNKGVRDVVRILAELIRLIGPFASGCDERNELRLSQFKSLA